MCAEATGQTTIIHARLEAAHRLGHSVLDGSVSPQQPLLVSGWDAVQACLVCVSDPRRERIVTLGTGESIVGRGWSRTRPQWPATSDVMLFENRQFSYICRPSGVWLTDLSTTNGTLVLTHEEAAGLPPYGPRRTTDQILPHPNNPQTCESLYRWVARDGDVVASYAAFVLCHPPTRFDKT